MIHFIFFSVGPPILQEGLRYYTYQNKYNCMASLVRHFEFFASSSLHFFSRLDVKADILRYFRVHVGTKMQHLKKGFICVNCQTHFC